VSERDIGEERELARRAKEAFDRSTAALDAATRSRLTQARHRALQELERGTRRDWRWSLAPAGVLATAALAAWLLLWQGPAAIDSRSQMAAFGDLDILLGEEDLEMLDEDIEFYAWLEEQPEFAAPAAADDGVG
jgi:hypothetical protein